MGEEMSLTQSKCDLCHKVYSRDKTISPDTISVGYSIGSLIYPHISAGACTECQNKLTNEELAIRLDEIFNQRVEMYLLQEVYLY